MENLLSDFLECNYIPGKPILLALSGGPDSLALFHLLVDCQKKMPLQLGVAHIDHGWRPESPREAEQLKHLVEHYHLPFHLKKLDPSRLKGNLEDASRRERLAFYRHLCSEYGYQAVLLGHQRDDQAETVLKRILEGASLPFLAGLEERTYLDGLMLWRPLLRISKRQIVYWLQERGIKAFEDSTNLDPKFLRGRFRSVIVPQLSKDFGKQVEGNLWKLG
jgi:tRNA(Ile)-lysidine synthase